MYLLLYTLLATHITIICVTIYLHRYQAHRSLLINPVLAHFMRFWLWLTTGMVTKQWVAIHRSHHRFCEHPGDPHSPKVFGIWRVVFGGVFLYTQAAKNTKMIEQYGAGTPDDWIENNLYSRFPYLGVSLLAMINLLLFGWVGILVWAVQMIWIPFWAAGVINGIGHWWGYRNSNTKDNSRNIVPWGILIGGEELHNNHHKSPKSPKLSHKWWEFDVGWFYIKLLKYIKLVEIKEHHV